MFHAWLAGPLLILCVPSVCTFDFRSFFKKPDDFFPVGCWTLVRLLHLSHSPVVVFHGSHTFTKIDMSIGICVSCHSVGTLAHACHGLVWLCVQAFCFVLSSLDAVSAFLPHWSHLSSQDKRGICAFRIIHVTPQCYPTMWAIAQFSCQLWSTSLLFFV